MQSANVSSSSNPPKSKLLSIVEDDTEQQTAYDVKAQQCISMIEQQIFQLRIRVPGLRTINEGVESSPLYTQNYYKFIEDLEHRNISKDEIEIHTQRIFDEFDQIVDQKKESIHKENLAKEILKINMIQDNGENSLQFQLKKSLLEQFNEPVLENKLKLARHIYQLCNGILKENLEPEQAGLIQKRKDEAVNLMKVLLHTEAQQEINEVPENKVLFVSKEQEELDKKRNIKQYDERSRQELRIELIDGLFKQYDYASDDFKLFSSKQYRAQIGVEHCAFVMSDNKFYAFTHLGDLGRRFHSSVFPEAADDKTTDAKKGGIDMAGEFKIERGKLISITNLSGHYKPSPEKLYDLLNHLKENKVDLSETIVQYATGPGEKQQCSAVDFMNNFNPKKIDTLNQGEVKDQQHQSETQSTNTSPPVVVEAKTHNPYAQTLSDPTPKSRGQIISLNSLINKQSTVTVSPKNEDHKQSEDHKQKEDEEPTEGRRFTM